MLKPEECLRILVLHEMGHSIRCIRKITGHDRKSIRKVLTKPLQQTLTTRSDDRAGHEQGTVTPQAGQRRRAGRPSAVEPFKTFVLDEVRKGVSIQALLAKLRGQGFGGSSCALRRFLRVQRAQIISKSQQIREWMHLVLQGAVAKSEVACDLGQQIPDDDLTLLLQCVRTKPLRLRNRALAILAHVKGASAREIALFLCLDRRAVRNYLAVFKRCGVRPV
jgi:hypothetical protein